MDNWEYKVLYFSPYKNIEEELNNLGSKGWEMTGVFATSDTSGAIFLKRRK